MLSGPNKRGSFTGVLIEHLKILIPGTRNHLEAPVRDSRPAVLIKPIYKYNSCSSMRHAKEIWGGR